MKGEIYNKGVKFGGKISQQLIFRAVKLENSICKMP